MRTLAIETSSLGGSVAAVVRSVTQPNPALAAIDELATLALPREARTTRTLAPTIEQVLRIAGWRPTDVELVGVTSGPGSFTGLRIGITTAKAFAYATGAKIVGVPTLRVLAEQAPDSAKSVVAVLDAQRKQLFSATFERSSDGEWKVRIDDHIVDLGPWLATLEDGQWVTGSGLSLVRDALPAHVNVVVEADWAPRAVTVGRLALQRAAFATDTVWSLVPSYLRASAAEEKSPAPSSPFAPRK